MGHDMDQAADTVAHMPSQSNTGAEVTVCPLADLLVRPVTELIIAMGSNHMAEHYLPIARQHLASMGQLQVSAVLINADFTATTEQPKPDYCNQCVHLQLPQPMRLAAVIEQLKHTERCCGRQQTQHKLSNGKVSNKVASDDHASNKHVSNKEAGNNAQSVKQVSLDMDVLAVQLCGQPHWTIIKKRHPFKAHERSGLLELGFAGLLLSR